MVRLETGPSQQLTFGIWAWNPHDVSDVAAVLFYFNSVKSSVISSVCVSRSAAGVRRYERDNADVIVECRLIVPVRHRRQ